jgi:phage terminase small subunit
MSELVGPKMAALWDDRVRTFALIMAAGEENGAKAAREAGYSDAGEACKVRASELMHNPAVLAAIEEASRSSLQWLAPRAIGAAKAILGDPKHKAHARMIEVVLDRTGFFAKTEHKVTVEHTVDLKDLEALARRLAQENGIAPERFIGLGPVIEGEATEVADGSSSSSV